MPCGTFIPNWQTWLRNMCPRNRPEPSSTPSCRWPVPSGRRWTTWPPTRSSSRARSFPIYGVPTGDWWRGYPSQDLPVAQPACQPHWWSRSQLYLLHRMCWVHPRPRQNPTLPLPERWEQLRTPGRSHTNLPNKLPGCSGGIWREEKRMRRHVNRKRSTERSPQGPTFFRWPWAFGYWPHEAGCSESGFTASHKASGSKDWGKVRVGHPPADQSDNEPLSDRAEEPKAKSRKWDPTPDLVVLEDDDSTPLPGKIKSTGKKAHTHNLGEDEGFEALSQCLKGEARAIQYNLELAILTEYRNLHISNLKGPPNTDDHSAYLSIIKDVSWSYPAKGNLITACQFFKDLKSSGDREAIEAGDNVLWEKGMMGIPQESVKAGPIKCWYVCHFHPP